MKGVNTNGVEKSYTFFYVQGFGILFFTLQNLIMDVDSDIQKFDCYMMGMNFSAHFFPTVNEISECFTNWA